ncbi:MAG: type II toxin-antitoxin system RelE family toxin [bacterium]
MGDYRVIYTIDDANQCVVIVRVGHRREVYR